MKNYLLGWLFFLCQVLFSAPYDVLVVGGGPAGLTAGIYSSRLDLKTFIAEGEVPGGQLMTTHLVENFPGFIEGVDGAQLISNMRSQAVKYGAQIKSLNVIDITLDSYPYKVTLSNHEILEAKSLIIATGSSPKLLGLESEKALMGAGVSTCAVCDAPFYRGKDVVVVGGGDSAFEEALMLASFAKKVTLLHRSDRFRASEILRNRANLIKNIEIKTFKNLIHILDPGKGYVEGVVVWDGQTKQQETISCEGVFIAIGQSPNTFWLGDKVKCDDRGIIIETPPGIFSAGDVVDFKYRQAITAAGSGCQAALNAYQYVKLQKEK